jgi:hypothetical protein
LRSTKGSKEVKHLLISETKIKETIKSNANLNQQYKLIKSIPGVGQQTATYSIIGTKGFKALIQLGNLPVILMLRLLNIFQVLA